MNLYSAYCGTGMNFYHNNLKDATIIVDELGFKTTYLIDADGNIVDTSVEHKANSSEGTGKSHQFVRGKFEKWFEKGKLITEISYREGTNRGKHGDYMVTEKIPLGRGEEYKGTITGRYYRGSMATQRFVYDNGQEAYSWKKNLKELIVLYPDGTTWFYLSGSLRKPSGYSDPYILIDGNGYYHLGENRKPSDIGNVADEIVEYDLQGVIKNKYQYENNQKTGVGIEDYKEKYYMSGVAVSKKIFESDGTDYDPMEVLAIDNSQLRTALMNKVGMERLLTECKGKVIHEDKEQGRDNKLIRISFVGKAGEVTYGDKFMQILQVTCPSTSNKYYLRVPPDVDNCEDARQWTMGVEKTWFNRDEPITHLKFHKET